MKTRVFHQARGSSHMSLSCRVSNIQQQLAQLESESWPGLAEADRDRLQLAGEKEALLQELQLIIQQRRPAEDVVRLGEERGAWRRRSSASRATSMQGATERWAGSAGGAVGKARLHNCTWSLIPLAATAWWKVEGACTCLSSRGPSSAQGSKTPGLCSQVGDGREGRQRREEDRGTHDLDPVLLLLQVPGAPC